MSDHGDLPLVICLCLKSRAHLNSDAGRTWATEALSSGNLNANS